MVGKAVLGELGLRGLKKNKESLIAFLLSQWKGYSETASCGVLMYFAGNKKCYKLFGQTKVSDLACDHQAADTRLFLHVQHAAHFFPNVLIVSPDTDVFVLAISNVYTLACDIIIQMMGNWFNISLIKRVFSKEVCGALLGLHCFTGCDTVSSFRGKGKKRALACFKTHPQFAKAFAALGNEWTPTEELKRELEKFTCTLYGDKTASGVDKLRYRLFQKKDNVFNNL